MDIVDFLNDVTDGHLLAWKVVVASLVFALAGLQVALAASLWGVGGIPIRAEVAAGVHRWSGRLLLVLAVGVAFSCLIGPAGPTSPTRVLLHSLFGTALFVLLIVKFALLKFVRSGQQWLPLAGTLLFLSFFAVWATSVADYVSREVMAMRPLSKIGPLLAAAALLASSAVVPLLPFVAVPSAAAAAPVEPVEPVAPVAPPRSATPVAPARSATPAKPVLAARLAQGGAGAQAIQIVDFDFDANQTSVPVGTTVTWTNTGERPHTATDRGGTFDTQPVDPGASASVTFTVPGTYSYFCRINPSKMNGTLVVEGDTAASKVVRIQGVDDANIAGEKLRFDPPTVSVATGTTLLFANAGGKPHTLTADDGSFTTGIVQPGPEGGRFAGTNATVTMDKPGTFPYHCDIHPQPMKGTITVTGSQVTGGPSPPSAGARTAAVDIVDFEFREAQVSVGPGAQVTFTNQGQAPHTATSDDVPGLDTGQVTPDAAAQLTAPLKPGSYSYKCTIHPARMRAVLVVLGQSTPDPVRNTATTAAAAGGGDGNRTATTQQAGAAAPTIAPTPPAGYTSNAGVSGGIAIWVLVTGVLAAFLAGVGVASFLRRRSGGGPPAPPEPTPVT